MDRRGRALILARCLRAARWLASGLLPTVALVLAAEIVARLLGASAPDPNDALRVWFKPIAPVVVSEPSRDGPRWVIQPQQVHGALIPQARLPGEMRVFSFGASTTWGHRLKAGEAFAFRVGEYLQAAHPGRRVQAVNLGVPARDSYDMLKLAESSLRFSPDVWILYEGHNDLVNYQLRPRLFAFMKRHEWLWSALFALQDHSRLVSGLGHRLNAGPKAAAHFPGWRALDAYEARVIDQLIANYEKILALAEAHGVRVIVVLPASNLFDQEPFFSFDDLDELAELGDQAEAARARGELAAALALYRRALALSPKNALMHFRAAHIYDALHDAPSMYRELVAARDLDPTLERATTRMQEAQRAFALRHRLALVDAPALLATASPEQRVGCNFFDIDGKCDQLHPNAAAHALIARALTTIISAWMDAAHN